METNITTPTATIDLALLVDIRGCVADSIYYAESEGPLSAADPYHDILNKIDNLLSQYKAL